VDGSLDVIRLTTITLWHFDADTGAVHHIIHDKMHRSKKNPSSNTSPERSPPAPDGIVTVKNCFY